MIYLIVSFIYLGNINLTLILFPKKSSHLNNYIMKKSKNLNKIYYLHTQGLSLHSKSRLSSACGLPIFAASIQSS